ncbi:MAG: Ada metal-binding domain-containing protein [Bacillota bacterium]
MVIPLNVKCAELFAALQREAREAGRGLWAAEEEEKTDLGQVYYASAKSDKFHYLWCKWAKEIKPENLIVFKSREEAVEAGYVPCKVCKP